MHSLAAGAVEVGGLAGRVKNQLFLVSLMLAPLTYAGATLGVRKGKDGLVGVFNVQTQASQGRRVYRTLWLGQLCQ